MDQNENSLTDLRVFFSTKENPVSLTELKQLWVTLRDDEKEYFKTAKLSD